MRRILAIAFFVAACGSPATPAPTAFAISGSITLTTDANGMAFDKPNSQTGVTRCFGVGGYDDMTTGTGVTIKDQTGTIIATSVLGDGAAKGRLTCVFPFTATVPSATFYSIEVGHRGAVTYSFDQMAAKAWVVALTLGE